MKHLIYDVDYFIKKFEAIPENLWFTGNFCDKTGKKKCALGHCEECNEDVALHRLFPNPCGDGSSIIAIINDGKDFRYVQKTPKKRVLAALYDIKNMQQPEVKERIVYVTVDQKVRELQAETINEN